MSERRLELNVAGKMGSTNISLFLTYLVTVTVLMLTPGPDMRFRLATRLKAGPRVSRPPMRLAALFRAAPLLVDGVRMLGAAYLVLLGICVLRNRNEGIGGKVR